MVLPQNDGILGLAEATKNIKKRLLRQTGTQKNVIAAMQWAAVGTNILQNPHSNQGAAARQKLINQHKITQALSPPKTR